MTLALGGVPHLDDPRARLDEAAEDGLLGDDPRVVPGVRRRRDEGGERVQVLGTAGAEQLALLRELVGDRDDVGGLAPGVERDHRVEDELVLRDVEVRAANRLEHIGGRVLREQHPADRGLLGEEIVGRNSIAVLAARTLAVPPGPGRLVAAAVGETREAEVGDGHGYSSISRANARLWWGVRWLPVIEASLDGTTDITARGGIRGIPSAPGRRRFTLGTGRRAVQDGRGRLRPSLWTTLCSACAKRR